MELLDNAIVCFHTPSRYKTVTCNEICFFASDQNEFPARRLFCILKVARYIYLTEF